MLRKYLFQSFVLVMMLTLFACGSDEAPSKKEESSTAVEKKGGLFASQKIEQEVRVVLKKTTGPLEASDITELKKINLAYKVIKDISGIEQLVGLNELTLKTNWISDLSPLASMTHLTWLHIGDQNKFLSDISPLALLTNLEELRAPENEISDLSPLVNLTKLHRLDLAENKITDVSLLASLTNLTYLNLKNNEITDISPLVSLTKLTELFLHNNPMDDDSLKVIIPRLKAAGVKVYH